VGQLLFIGVVFAVISALHYYLWRRLVRDTTRPGRARRIGTWVMIGLVVLVITTFVGTRVLPHVVAVVLAWPGFLWLAVMFYLLVGLVLMEAPALVARLVMRRRVPVKEAALVPVGGPPEPPEPSAPDARDAPDTGDTRRLFLSRAVAITVGVAAVGLVGSGVSTALGMPQLKRVRIPLARLPRSADGFRIALVSDIHLGPLNGIGRTRRIVDMINGLDADLVAMVGDMVDGSVAELGPAASPLGNLRSRLGTYFVTGNHEYFSGYEEWIQEVARLGMRPLRNARVELPGGLDLAGINDPTGSQFGDRPDVAKALGNRDKSRPVVLLAHQPVQAFDAAAMGVDLQLSGHTHGGQMVPFNLVVRASGQPVVRGLGDVDGMPVYVTNGAGFWGPPVRIGAPPDITLVELTTP
jgi:predicted MPP superfamily phosphohydrolase